MIHEVMKYTVTDVMAVGIFGAVGTGQTWKQMPWWHKQSGLAMVALILCLLSLAERHRASLAPVRRRASTSGTTGWLPFHLGFTALYHCSQGRGVVRKISPFI